jgi:hypothetical protein
MLGQGGIVVIAAELVHVLEHFFVAKEVGIKETSRHGVHTNYAFDENVGCGFWMVHMAHGNGCDTRPIIVALRYLLDGSQPSAVLGLECDRTVGYWPLSMSLKINGPF